ncbi:MAG TPA: glycosyltransferase [Cyclobacteriaceae bacterium]|nr:glycosyltransferase [Cyclobacteriaceae bacterium]
MSATPKYSIIVPVYNRPQEMNELLESLTAQVFTNFEVLIVEDGSTVTCVEVYERYTNKLRIRYFFKPNSGPGSSRNFGFAQAKGDYFVVFDSDCILPPHYFKAVDEYLAQTPLDAWGGPDKGHEGFTKLQQAMAFTMSSVFTTGGIRGGDKRIGSFQPRSFNMGISKEVYDKTGGFKFERYAEDIEFSLRMKKLGYKVGYINDAFVYHKRRTNFKQFFWQVFNFGRGRVLVNNAHPGAIKITHWFPSLFLLGMVLSIVIIPIDVRISAFSGMVYLAYILILAVSAYKKTKSLSVTLLVGPAAFVQLTGYGAGFLKEILRNLHE